MPGAPSDRELPDLTSYGELTDDLLTREVRLLQRKAGHRFSSDDVITAWVAYGAAPHAKTVLDLGCGIGSVLLHLAWSMPSARLVGIEAQEVSFALLQHNVARNRLGARVAIWRGDLRDPAQAENLGGPFALVTGTPPYFPPNAAVDAMDAQRAYARIEYRGGVEAYMEAAARYLAPDGTLVLCGDAKAQARVLAAAEATQLALVAQTDVVAHAPKPPLFAVWTLQRRGARPAAGHPVVPTQFVIRDAAHQPTDDARRLKAFSGF